MNLGPDLDHMRYLFALAGCLVVTVPLEFIYGFRLWRNPGRLIRAVAPGVVVFYLWDAFAIHRDEWGFNGAYTTGLKLPGHVPIEELLFFIVIPSAAIAGFEAVRAGLASRKVSGA